MMRFGLTFKTTARAARLKRAASFMVVTLTTSVLIGCATAPGLAAQDRPKQWAQPVQTPPIGLFNIYQVSPDLYRSAQPPSSGLHDFKPNQTLVINGQPIKTIINLRSFHQDPALLSHNSQLQYKHIFFNTWNAEDQDVVEFLTIMSEPSNLPALVHCKHGSDRTGMMVAIYRIVIQGWDKKTALAEMQQGGFGFHPIWSNLERYINQMDVKKIKQQVNQRLNDEKRATTKPV